jgi:acetyl esterase/lipase
MTYLRYLAAAMLTASLQAQKAPADLDARLAALLKRFPAADANEDGKLTRDEAMAFNRTRRLQSKKQEPAVAPTHANISYADDRLQAFDLWLAEPGVSGARTPLCIFIHGGGFRGGDKRAIQKQVVARFLAAGVSFVSLNYRLHKVASSPTQLP